MALYEELYENNASNFLRKCNFNNSEIYMDDSYIFCNYEAIFQLSPSFPAQFC
jgi:hypothetical protein